jgi:hypothetical protein
MKKLLLTGGLILASLALASAQGTIRFNNTSSTFYVSTNGTGVVWGYNGTTTGVTDTNAGDYYYALLYDTSVPTSADPLTGGWADTGLRATNDFLFAGGIRGPGGGNGVALPQVAPGGSAYFEVMGWSASLNHYTLSQLLFQWNYGSGNWLDTGYFGISSPSAGAITLGGYGTPAWPATSLFGGTDGIQSGFLLNGVSFVPEPAALALVALGGGSLLLFRRKK